MVLKDKATDWTDDTIKERFLLCIGMLHLHGMMTDSERIKVQARLIKVQEKQNKEKADNVADNPTPNGSCCKLRRDRLWRSELISVL